jgi:hypothetical protein
MNAYYYTVDNRDREFKKHPYDTIHIVEIFNGSSPMACTATSSLEECLRIVVEINFTFLKVKLISTTIPQ